MTKVETLRSMQDKIIFLKIKIKVSSKFTVRFALSLVKSAFSLIFSIRGHVSPDFMLALADGTLPPIFRKLFLDLPLDETHRAILQITKVAKTD